MNDLLWKVIKKSKNGKEVLSSKVQYNNLKEILDNYDKNTVEKVYEQWRSKTKELINDKEFELLHANNVGIVYSGDDGFYMDFANWVIAQGEKLFNQFKKEGHKAILDYINKQQISEQDFMFECFIYVFHDYIE